MSLALTWRPRVPQRHLPVRPPVRQDVLRVPDGDVLLAHRLGHDARQRAQPGGPALHVVRAPPARRATHARRGAPAWRAHPRQRGFAKPQLVGWLVQLSAVLLGGAGRRPTLPPPACCPAEGGEGLRGRAGPSCRRTARARTCRPSCWSGRCTCARSAMACTPPSPTSCTRRAARCTARRPAASLLECQLPELERILSGVTSGML